MQARPCVMDAQVRQAIHAATGDQPEMMMDMYKKYWQPFGLLLTDMEKDGMSVNRCAVCAVYSPSLHIQCTIPQVQTCVDGHNGSQAAAVKVLRCCCCFVIQDYALQTPSEIWLATVWQDVHASLATL